MASADSCQGITDCVDMRMSKRECEELVRLLRWVESNKRSPEWTRRPVEYFLDALIGEADDADV